MRLLVFLVWSQSVPHFKLHNIDQQQNILTKWLEKLYNCGFLFYSIFDLQMSNPDPLLPSLLERTPADELDLANQEERQLHRMHSLFSIYPIQQVSRENMIIASNSHWLSWKRENIKETDNEHCRGQLRALETEKILVPHGVSEFFSISCNYERMKNVLISLLSSKLSSILFYLQMKNMFN